MCSLILDSKYKNNTIYLVTRTRLKVIRFNSYIYTITVKFIYFKYIVALLH